MIKNVLSIAGSDPSGGAGIQADLKTFAALGVYGMAVPTALTAQNTGGVSDVFVLPTDFVHNQLKAIFEDIDVHAIKIGMLASAEIIEEVAERLKDYDGPVVLDPVMVATSGDSLLEPDAIDAFKEHLIPRASLITPNIPEAQKLTKTAVIDMEAAAEKLLTLGCEAALLKGGHLNGETSPDYLATPEGVFEFTAPRIKTDNTHGTGCTLSSAMAAYLAQGDNLNDAVWKAKEYLTKAIKEADQLSVGSGKGPVKHI